jgi:hypothetical protein
LNIQELEWDVIDRLPSWLQEILFLLIGVALTLYLIKHIFRALTDPELLNSARTLGGAIRNGFFASLRFIFAPLVSPIQRPNTQLIMAWLSVFHSYLSAVIFFVLLLIFGTSYFLSNSDMSLLENLGAIGGSLVLFYFSVFFRAETDRDYLRAKELWNERKRVRESRKLHDNT